MPKLIIDYPDNMHAVEACWYALKVAQQGRPSVAGGIDHFCWVSTFRNGVEVQTRRKKKQQSADSLLITLGASDGEVSK